MKVNPLLLCGVLLSQTVIGEALNFEAIARAGIDSNPLQLSDTLNVVDEEFALAGFYSDSQYADWIYWDVNVQKSLYFNDSRIDHFTGDFSLKLADDIDIAGFPLGYEVGGGYAMSDETYVSKETGLVATYDDNSISDRFDREANHYLLGISHPFSERVRLSLRYTSEKNAFETYDFDGLDNLDHQEDATQLGILFSPQQNARYFLNFTHFKRRYDERLDRSDTGELVADSELLFNRYGVSAGYNVVTESDNHWRLAFSYINRSSNGTPYYDAQRAKVEIAADFNLADYHQLSFQLNYHSFFFDESFEQPFAYLDKDDIERQGGDFVVEYRWIVATFFKSNLGFYANLAYSQYTSPNEFYAFERNQASLGVRWSMD